MTGIEQRFDRYFKSLDISDSLHNANILNLDRAPTTEVRELVEAFKGIRAEINERFATTAVDIFSPTGEVHIHMDYIASSEVNAVAFQFEGWYFIGITEGMLALFAKSCSDLWRLNLLGGLLGVKLTNAKKDVIFQFLLLLELQYISNHELGHMFHGHCADLSSGRYRAEFDARTLAAESIGMEGQAKELEADGYAVNLLLKNLLQSASGTFIHQRLGSPLPEREIVITLFVLSTATVLYYLEPPAKFDPAKVKQARHSDGMVRMNILLGEALGWCADNVNWSDAIPLRHFQRIMSLITMAARSPAQEAIWIQQGAYLQTEEGKTYLTDIYKRRVNLRKKMEPHRWRLKSEMNLP